MIRSIDPARFAREGAHLEGTLSPDQLPRLVEELFDARGRVGYRLDGAIGPKGEPALHVVLELDVAGICQRCMEQLPLQLTTDRRLFFRADAGEFDPAVEEEDDVDVLPLAASVDVLDLIDQEAVLSLPIAPRHEEAQCAVRTNEESGSEKASPFAALSRLKRT